MKGHSGTTSFEFEIERYKDKKTGDLFTYEQISDESKYEYVTLILDVEGSSYFSPGKSFGFPENCYPDEGETEIISVLDSKGKDWETRLTDQERETVLIMIEENVQTDGPDPDIDCDDF